MHTTQDIHIYNSNTNTNDIHTPRKCTFTHTHTHTNICVRACVRVWCVCACVRVCIYISHLNEILNPPSKSMIGQFKLERFHTLLKPIQAKHDFGDSQKQ